MVNEFKLRSWECIVDHIFLMVCSETGQKHSIVVNPLYKSMCSISVSFNSRKHDRSMFIFNNMRFLNSNCSSRYCFIEDTCCIINMEGYIFDSVSVSGNVFIKFLMTCRIQSSLKYKSDFSITDCMGSIVAISCLKALVS